MRELVEVDESALSIYSTDSFNREKLLALCINSNGNQGKLRKNKGNEHGKKE